MIASQPDYPLDYDWLAENVSTQELAEIIDCVVSSADGDKLTCYCSHHHDENPSCSFNRVDGRTVVHCFACELSGSPVQAAAIVWDVEEPDAARRLRSELLALRNGSRVTGSATASSEPDSVKAKRRKPSLTLSEYSEAKGVPRHFLTLHRVQEIRYRGGTALEFWCCDTEGNLVARRYRLWMENPDGHPVFEQEKKKALVPYGLEKLRMWKTAGRTELILVEGESDALTLWLYDRPAVGIPGAQTFKKEWTTLFEDFDVLVWQEKGDAAEKLVRRIGATIPSARVIHDPEHDDVSDLHLALEGETAVVQAHLDALIRDSRPISSVIRETNTSRAVAMQGPWSDPILPGSDPAPPQYPLDRLPKALRHFVEEISRFTQVSTDMTLLPCLSTISATIANKVIIDYRWPEPPQLWTASISPSGTRKSPIFKHVARPLSDWQREEEDRTAPQRHGLRTRRESLEKKLQKVLNSTAKEDLLSSEWVKLEDEQTKIRELIAELPSDSPPRVIVYDATPEALIPLLSANNERLAVMAAEAEALRVVAGRYSDEPNLGLWKAAYDGEAYAYDRVRDNTHLRLDNPALAITLLFQPTVMETIRNRAVLEGEGVFARFLFGVPESNVGYRDTGLAVAPIDQSLRESYGRRLEGLLNAPFPKKDTCVPSLTFTRDSLTLLHSLEAELEASLRPEGASSPIKEWGNKSTGRAIRIAGVLHCFEAAGSAAFDLSKSAPISEDMVLAAADLVRASTHHALAAYRMFGRDEKTEALVYVLGRYRSLLEQSSVITRRDLYRATQNHSQVRGQVRNLDPFIEELANRDVLRLTKQPTGGRPTVILEPNPAIRRETGSNSANSVESPPAPNARNTSDTSGTLTGGESGAQSMNKTEGSARNLKEVEDQKGVDEEFTPDPPQRKIHAHGEDEFVPGVHDSEGQKGQNSSAHDDPDSLPPTAELF